MLIYDNDFRPVAIMIVGKAKITASGSFWISHEYLGKNLGGLIQSEIINSPPAANNSLNRNPLFFI